MRHRVLTNYFAESDKVDADDVLRQLVDTMRAGASAPVAIAKAEAKAG